LIAECYTILRKIEHYCSAQKKMLDIRSFSMPVGWEESAAPCPLDGGINN